MNLPKPCANCGPDGLWREKAYERGYTRCDCERGRTLAALDEARKQPALSRVDPLISLETAAAGVSILSALRYFPSEDGARIAIGNELRSMCNSGDEMLWACARMVRLFTDWPGVPSLRAVYCSKFFPLDRDTRGVCPDYPDGVPPEVEQTPTLRALPPGSVDVQLDAVIQDLARLKTL